MSTTKTTKSPDRIACSPTLRRRLRGVGRKIGRTVVEAVGEHLPSTAEEFAALERRLSQVGVGGLIGPVLELVLGAIHADEEFVAGSVARAAETRPLAVNIDRDVAVALVNGGVALVPRTPYAKLYLRDLDAPDEARFLAFVADAAS